MLRGTPQPAVSRQGHDQPPLGVGAGVDHPLCLVAGEEVEPIRVVLFAAGDFRKGVLPDQLPAECCAEELPGPLHFPADRHRGQALADQALFPLVRLSRRDLPQGLALGEVPDQQPPGGPVVAERVFLSPAQLVRLGLQQAVERLLHCLPHHLLHVLTNEPSLRQS